MTHEEARHIVAPFYDALTQPATKDVRRLVETVVSAEWRSYASESSSKGREEFIQQVVGFGKLVPDLTWTIKELLVDGNRIVVRSEATGTPAGEFMGVAHSGRRFSIMTIDIHTVRGSNLVIAYHVEDWASALQQLAGR